MKYFKFQIYGIVQGVGFRPFILNEARKFGLKGYVQNLGDCVLIISNKKEKIFEILNYLPKLAKINRIDCEEIEIENKFESFTIKISENSKLNYSPIPADLNLCEDCLFELFQEGNLRKNYFFISCVNCGPRFSIIKKTPYDRENTSLDIFKLCDDCKKDYFDTNNRRFHAQTIACVKCGPKLNLYKNSNIIKVENIIECLANLIKNDHIVAIKSLGGFHLVSNTKENTVNKLKSLIKRFHKPFALMAKDISMIEKFCNLNLFEKNELESSKRPIVLLEKKDKNFLNYVSELSSLGFMLPYSGIHYLLFEEINEALIYTSSNFPSMPISKKKEEQIVEYVLDYDREIINSIDDSIIKIIEDKSLIIRRSRAYAPNEILIPSNYDSFQEEILSFGSELKNTFCIKKNNKLILSQHMGNAYNYDNLIYINNYLDKFLDFSSTNAKIILCDFNSEFNISKLAKEYSQKRNIKSFAIQHHIAHAFSIALEHNLNNFLAIICDGTGLGYDNKIWGGEVFHNDIRIGHLEEHNLIGGDIANKEPLRLLLSILSNFLNRDEILYFFKNDPKIDVFLEMDKENFNCIKTSSCGRILDAMAILLDLGDINYYEGRLAMLLESNSLKTKLYFEPIIIKDKENKSILLTSPLFKFVYENKDKIPKENLAYFTQEYIAKGLYLIAKEYDSDLEIVFGGGCAYNNIMTKFMLKNNVKINKEIPCGDAGISAGQIAYYLWKNKSVLNHKSF